MTDLQGRLECQGPAECIIAFSITYFNGSSAGREVSRFWPYLPCILHPYNGRSTLSFRLDRYPPLASSFRFLWLHFLELVQDCPGRTNATVSRDANTLFIRENSSSHMLHKSAIHHHYRCRVLRLIEVTCTALRLYKYRAISRPGTRDRLRDPKGTRHASTPCRKSFPWRHHKTLRPVCSGGDCVVIGRSDAPNRKLARDACAAGRLLSSNSVVIVG